MQNETFEKRLTQLDLFKRIAWGTNVGIPKDVSIQSRVRKKLKVSWRSNGVKFIGGLTG